MLQIKVCVYCVIVLLWKQENIIFQGIHNVFLISYHSTHSQRQKGFPEYYCFNQNVHFFEVAFRLNILIKAILKFCITN